MEAETQDGQRHSILLQNAETVRLIGPGHAQSGASGQHSSQQTDPEASGSTVSAEEEQQAQSDAVSVSELQTGRLVYLHLQGSARHTGISIQEKIVEK